MALTINSMENLICGIRIFYVGFLSPLIGYIVLTNSHFFGYRLASYIIGWMNSVIHQGLVVYLATLASLRAYYLKQKATHCSVFDLDDKFTEIFFITAGTTIYIIIATITFVGTPYCGFIVELFIDFPNGTERKFLPVSGVINISCFYYHLASSIGTIYIARKLYLLAKNSQVNRKKRMAGSMNVAFIGIIHITVIILNGCLWGYFFYFVVGEWTNHQIILINIFNFSILYGMFTPVVISLNYMYTRDVLRKFYHFICHLARNRIGDSNNSPTNPP